MVPERESIRAGPAAGRATGTGRIVVGDLLTSLGQIDVTVPRSRGQAGVRPPT